MARHLTADVANNINKLQDYIETTVASQLDIIDQKILSHNMNWGRNVAQINMPENFVMNKLEKADAQRVVYSKVIKSLKKRGFDVRISLGRAGTGTTLFVAWMVGYREDEKEKMDDIIYENELQPNEVERWVAGR